MVEVASQAAVPKPRRHWFQFSLRTLLVAVTLVCVWLSVVVNRAEKQRRAVDAVVRLGGLVVYDYQIDANGDNQSPTDPPGPKWLRDLIGIHYFANVVHVNLRDSHFTDADLEPLKELPQLHQLLLGGTQVSDAGLKYIEELRNLRWLDLPFTQISDAGLVHIKELRQLRTLNLEFTRITDAGLPHIEGLKQLRWLDLRNTQITDTGMAHVEGLTQLQWLDVADTQVTDVGLSHIEGLKDLQFLNLAYTQTTDAGLVHLQGLKELVCLDLSDAVTDAGRAELRRALPNSNHLFPDEVLRSLRFWAL